MAFGEIRSIDRSCRSYRPGHQVHWIQAKKSVEDQQPVIDVAVVVRDDGRVAIEGDELTLTMWNHDPAGLQSAVYPRGHAVWKPRLHVLSVAGLFGYVFKLAPLDKRTEC
jgi:hypothetical protein